MSDKKRISVLVIGVSLLDGMASSNRVRNLIEPLINDNSIAAKNLIYSKHRIGEVEKLDFLKLISYRIIDFRLKNPFSIIKFLREGLKFIRRSKIKTDKNILYHYDYPDIKSIFFIFFAKILGYKVIIDLIEDNSFVTHYVSFMNKVRIMSSRLFLKISPLVTNTYIAISSHLVNKIQELTDKPVHLIPISVNLDFFKAGDDLSDPRELRIFYGGSFAHKDGLARLIATFDEISKKFDHVSLVLTGRGLKSDLDAVLLQVQGLEHKDRVQFKGYLETDAYYALMSECEIFCMTRNRSQYANAGFPFKLGEFLAAGKGVIATKIGDVQNYLVNGHNCLLIDSECAEQLSEAIIYFIQNRDQIRTLGKRARATAELNFDSSKLSQNVLKVFKGV